jgi:hypothetical protein
MQAVQEERTQLVDAFACAAVAGEIQETSWSLLVGNIYWLQSSCAAVQQPLLLQRAHLYAATVPLTI